MNLIALAAAAALRLLDPTGDAAGDGTLMPPTSPAYADLSVFDLQEVALVPGAVEGEPATLAVAMGSIERSEAMPGGFNRVVVDEHYGGLAFEEEGERCAKLFSDRSVKVMVMGNHGVGLLREESGAAPYRRPGGCVDVHMRYVEVAGVTVLGVEGSARYREGPFQYKESEYACMLARLTPRLLLEQSRRGRAVDVLLTHAPPVGPSAGSDHAHRGVPAFNAFHRRWRPLVHVHGHVHLEGGGPREHVTPDGVRVVNAFGYTLIDL